MPYDVTFKRLPVFALYDFKGVQAAIERWTKLQLPNSANRRADFGGNTLCHIGPNHWLLRADLAAEPQLELQLKPTSAPPDISIVRISDSQTFFRITGPDAEKVTAIGCPMDLHPSVFPETAVSFTEFFHVKALILRTYDGFDIAVEQSFANMTADYLTRTSGHPAET